MTMAIDGTTPARCPRHPLARHPVALAVLLSLACWLVLNQSFSC